MVEFQPSKLDAAGSNPVARSTSICRERAAGSAGYPVARSTFPAATAERIVPGHYHRNAEEQALLARHQFAYACVAKLAAPDQPLLEIGCGEGYGTGWLAERFAAVDAVDIDPGAVARAAALCAGHGQCRVQSYDGRTLPFPDATFATVVALQVIEHVAGPAAMLAEMARVARPGGLVLITTPNRAYRVAAGKKPWNRFHVREYDAGELRAELLPYFSTVTLHGVRARADIETREKDRCRRAQRLAALDPLNLRFLLTPALETGMARLLRRLARPAPAVQAVAATLADYYLSEDDPAEGLDLLAACRRPA